MKGKMGGFFVWGLVLLGHLWKSLVSLPAGYSGLSSRLLVADN